MASSERLKMVAGFEAPFLPPLSIHRKKEIYSLKQRILARPWVLSPAITLLSTVLDVLQQTSRMADPLSATASVLAIVTAAIVLVRSLYDTVKGF